MRSGARSVILPTKTVTGGPFGASGIVMETTGLAEIVTADMEVLGGFIIVGCLLFEFGLRGRWFL